MRTRVAAIVAVAAVLAWAGLAAAQAKPDFSGTWALDEAKSDPAPQRGGGRGGGGRAATLVIKQTASELTIERKGADGTTVGTDVIKLDGSESKIAVGRGGEMTVKASWDGGKLVIAGQMDMRGTMVERKDVYSLAGNVLTLERTTGQNTTKLVYNKKQ